MKYREVEQAVCDLVAAADEESRRRLGADMVVRLTRHDELADAAEIEFDEDALRAFAEACADPVHSTADQLRDWLARIDAGTLSEGDMDPEVLSALTALDRWGHYLAEADADAIAGLAILSLEEIDFEVSADIEDFLATPEMAAEFARITSLLT